MEMLTQLFDDVGAHVALEELDIARQNPPTDAAQWDEYDGFILPGSLASVAADSRGAQPEWVQQLAKLVRQLHTARRPTLGICFGHQLLASALGGRVEVCAHGLHAAACAFDLTPLGASALAPDATTRRVELQYHHSDVVSRLPTCAANLGCSATNPVHAAAYFASAAAARLAVTRGSLGAARDAPHALSFQAHPEFATPAGRRVLGGLLRECAAPSEEWAAERAATVDSPASAAASRALVGAAVRRLWPRAMAPKPSRS